MAARQLLTTHFNLPMAIQQQCQSRLVATPGGAHSCHDVYRDPVPGFVLFQQRGSKPPTRMNRYQLPRQTRNTEMVNCYNILFIFWSSTRGDATASQKGWAERGARNRLARWMSNQSGVLPVVSAFGRGDRRCDQDQGTQPQPQNNSRATTTAATLAT
jgi:hypothetical protein